MAWGYWSATSVSDRGRSPRREKDKQHQGLHQASQQQQQQQQQQQAQQQMHQSEFSAQSTYSSVQQERELGVGIATEEPPCMMIQGGSFYSYSAATAAAAASRRISNVEGGASSSSAASTGIQVLPRERHVRPGTSTYPPSSPGSGDSAEYEQPLAGHLRAAASDISPPSSRIGSSPPHHHMYHDDIFAQPGTSSSAVIRTTKLLQCPPDGGDGMDDLSETELDDATNVEMIYGRSIGPSATCRVHGPCGQQQPLLPPEPASSMTSLLDIEPAGPPQFQFNEITWGT